MNEVQIQKEKEKLEYISHLIATISPDPVRSKHCTRCHGKGYQVIDVSVAQGEIHYRIELCCGQVGTSSYAKLLEAINKGNRESEMRDGHTAVDLQLIQRDQFLSRKFVSFFNRKIRPVFKRKAK